MMPSHIQYLIDEKGSKTAVQIPFEEWLRFFEEYQYFKQYATLKQGLEDAFQEIKSIENGNQSHVTLEEFLNVCGRQRQLTRKRSH